MSYYRFKDTDVFTNVIKANPFNNFFIYSGSVFYRNTPYESGSVFQGNVTHVPVGAVSLYELNVDRAESDHTYNYEDNSGVKTMIHPFIVKNGGNLKFKSVSTGSYNVEDYGTTMTASFNYPLSASLSRELYPANHLASALNYSARSNVQLSSLTYDGFNTANSTADLGLVTVSSSYIEALKNTLDFYTPLSNHYEFTSSAKASDGTPLWDKGVQSINMINVPSIYYGSSIKKGSVKLRFYLSGTIIGECADLYENGELIEVSASSGYDRDTTERVAGVVLYNEGVILLTGSWNLGSGPATEPYGGSGATNPTWLYWGVGLTSSLNVPGASQLGSIAKSNGDVNYAQSLGYNIPSSSYSLDFRGIEQVPVKTMLAHAPKGELYYSNNPTFTVATTSSQHGEKRRGLPTAQPNYMSGSIQKAVTGSTFYAENDALEIKNINSSSFPNHTASFDRITYISKIGVYDDQKNLIGIAKVARPVKKTLERDLTFKLKIDI